MQTLFQHIVVSYHSICPIQQLVDRMFERTYLHGVENIVKLISSLKNALLTV